MRSYNRELGDMRPVSFEREVLKHADGSCLIKMGGTHVLCAASIQEQVPAWRGTSHDGWVTAEYAMLPCATGRRTPREYKGRKGRSMEIERLIGRSLRAAVNLRRMKDMTIIVDCDVLQADGGTRCASITGGWVALHDALMTAIDKGLINRLPLESQIAAISLGKVRGELMCDLDYSEDSNAEVDLNVVASGPDSLVEIQGTGEKSILTRQELNTLLDMSEPTLAKLFTLQNEVTNFLE